MTPFMTRQCWCQLIPIIYLIMLIMCISHAYHLCTNQVCPPFTFRINQGHLMPVSPSLIHNLPSFVTPSTKQKFYIIKLLSVGRHRLANTCDSSPSPLTSVHRHFLTSADGEGMCAVFPLLMTLRNWWKQWFVSLKGNGVSLKKGLSLRLPKCFLKVLWPITELGKGSYWIIDLT